MALWRLYYHLVWSTQNRHPLITADVEAELHGYIVGKAHSLGCLVHAIGGVEDHLHPVASIPPKLSISQFVQKVKGSSAHHLNTTITREGAIFKWQRGYGIFSLGSSQLAGTVQYVYQQKVHHHEGTLVGALEQEQDDDGPNLWRRGAPANVRVARSDTGHAPPESA